MPEIIASKNSKISEGEYSCKNGKTAWVWQYSKNVIGDWCWLGTVKGVGIESWDINGKSTSGDSEYDLVI